MFHTEPHAFTFSCLGFGELKVSVCDADGWPGTRGRAESTTDDIGHDEGT